MSKKPAMPPADSITLFDQLIAAHPEIERKGKTSPYTSHNGHMFTSLNKAGELGLRVGKVERARLLDEEGWQPFISYNTVMKEYAAVPDALLQDTAALLPYLELSYTYVKSLKPK